MIDEALLHYNLVNYKAELIRHNENITYKVTDDNGQYVLRIHKPVDGFNLDLLRMGNDPVKQIKDEMQLLKQLNMHSKLGTQNVVENIHSDSVTVLKDGTPVTVLKWIDGCTLENVDITEDICMKMGVMIAKMHKSLQGLHLENRYQYNEKLLLKMLDETDTAFDKGHLSKTQAETIKSTLTYIYAYFSKVKSRYVLVHSDLGKSNLIYQNGKIIPIDFSLSGISIPEMDLASAFCHINNENLNNCILNGYTSEMGYAVDKNGIDTCICLQILLFVLSQHDKVSGQPWFPGKVDEWCRDRFIPLITGEEAAKNIGLYI